jgi:hypothetical protein
MLCRLNSIYLCKNVCRQMSQVYFGIYVNMLQSPNVVTCCQSTHCLYNHLLCKTLDFEAKINETCSSEM